MGFFAKKEMEKIPCLAHWMRFINCLFLDRNNIKEGLKTILAGIEKVRRGVSVWIFPEGTRNKNEQLSDLLPFKEGSLKIAEKSGCPVVPVAISGARGLFEAHGNRTTPGTVRIRVLPPIQTAGMSRAEQKELPAAVRQTILAQL